MADNCIPREFSGDPYVNRPNVTYPLTRGPTAGALQKITNLFGSTIASPTGPLQGVMHADHCCRRPSIAKAVVDPDFFTTSLGAGTIPGIQAGAVQLVVETHDEFTNHVFARVRFTRVTGPTAPVPNTFFTYAAGNHPSATTGATVAGFVPASGASGIEIVNSFPVPIFLSGPQDASNVTAPIDVPMRNTTTGTLRTVEWGYSSGPEESVDSCRSVSNSVRTDVGSSANYPKQVEPFLVGAFLDDVTEHCDLNPRPNVRCGVRFGDNTIAFDVPRDLFVTGYTGVTGQLREPRNCGISNEYVTGSSLQIQLPRMYVASHADLSTVIATSTGATGFRPERTWSTGPYGQRQDLTDEVPYAVPAGPHWHAHRTVRPGYALAVTGVMHQIELQLVPHTAPTGAAPTGYAAPLSAGGQQWWSYVPGTFNTQVSVNPQFKLLQPYDDLVLLSGSHTLAPYYGVERMFPDQYHAITGPSLTIAGVADTRGAGVPGISFSSSANLATGPLLPTATSYVATSLSPAAKDAILYTPLAYEIDVETQVFPQMWCSAAVRELTDTVRGPITGTYEQIGAPTAAYLHLTTTGGEWDVARPTGVRFDLTARYQVVRKATQIRGYNYLYAVTGPYIVTGVTGPTPGTTSFTAVAAPANATSPLYNVYRITGSTGYEVIYTKAGQMNSVKEVYSEVAMFLPEDSIPALSNGEWVTVTGPANVNLRSRTDGQDVETPFSEVRLRLSTYTGATAP